MKLDHHNCSFLPGFTDAVALNKNLGVFFGDGPDLQLDPSRPDPLVTMAIVYAGLDHHTEPDDYFRRNQASGLKSVGL